MGLDVTAWERIERIGSGGDEDEGFHVWDGGGFPYLGPIETGSYVSVGGEEHCFRAGPYGGYSAWRAHLCRFVRGCEPEAVWSDRERDGAASPGPFLEIIDFTDCDGSIGPVVAAKLAADFAAHEERAVAFAAGLGEWSERFVQVYRDFRKAFEIAARGGVVIFH